MSEQTVSGTGGSRRHTRSFSIAKMAALMRADELLETFSTLAVKDSDLLRLVLQASVAALENIQSVKAVKAAMKRRAAVGN